MKKAKIAIAQINTIVGDLVGNTEKILFCLNESAKKRADIVVFPELSITGYPPEDLVLKPHFVKENIKCLNVIARAAKDIIAIVGFVDQKAKDLYNSAAVINNKKITHIYHKRHLPNYSVFDEKRYFKPGKGNALIKAKGYSFSLNICEDIWASEDAKTKNILTRADFLINISASPYHIDKIKERKTLLLAKARRFKTPVIYCNLVGGQDELVFDGRSAVFGKSNKIIAKAKAFEEDLLIVDLAEKNIASPNRAIRDMTRIEEVYSALVLGLRDYVRKNNFKKVAFGLSGGIDSALVAAVAVEALGKANVLALSMPSRYSSEATQLDAERIAKNLGVRFVKVGIDSIFDVYANTLQSHFSGMDPDITEENIQARIRGNILMAFSNKFGHLVLNTGNKSETSVGYCTLYGDMAGGFAVIKDVPKKLVYELAGFVNKKKRIIPDSVFKRPPSAELRPGQKDQDSLPPYDLVDAIVDLYVEKDKSFSDIVKKLGNKDAVRKVLSMIDMNEYKRRQAPPGIKVSPRAFGKDRRMPITNKYKGGGL
ncbi:NAD+ synthase [Candidatus Omnitrophota bacterium]